MQRKAPPRQQSGLTTHTAEARAGVLDLARTLVDDRGLLALAVLGTIYQAIATEIDQPSYSRRPDGGRRWPQLAHRTVSPPRDVWRGSSKRVTPAVRKAQLCAANHLLTRGQTGA
jgi:hypothetical protein